MHAKIWSTSIVFYRPTKDIFIKIENLPKYIHMLQPASLTYSTYTSGVTAHLTCQMQAFVIT